MNFAQGTGGGQFEFYIGAIHVARTGNILAVDQGSNARVMLFSNAGVYSGVYGGVRDATLPLTPGLMMSVSDVATDAAGNVYITDFQAAYVHKFAEGGAFLLAASLWLMPQWPGEWWSLFERTDHFAPPIARFGGIAICLVLLRWRRAEAWLVFVAACVPQTWYPYNSLILLIVAATYREACVLSLVSSFGWVIAALAGDGNTRSPESREIMGAMLVAACYLPATIVVLRRPDEGSWPFWMRWLRRPRDVYIESSGR